MAQRWARGLLALLFCLILVQGLTVPGATTAAVSPRMGAPSFHQGFGEGSGHTPKLDVKGLEAANGRSAGALRRDGVSDGPSDDPVTTLVVVAIALVFALPLRGSEVARSLTIGLTPEGRHREAGRCPTGPPCLAA